ncbi:hypothetical protein [Aromatoleum evansii]|uniref:hypothetical protein n=1 Tax=Aromatoleum evansii TaxID=59406 RepID=UPI00145F1663|nr:hypothetical protein [Aromatoleum evansii]NMG29591.1 hypothetical protein [Aromatoleum evansii]
MSEQDEERTPLRGYLTIHVGGYKQVRKDTYHVFSAHPTALVPDRCVQAATYDPDTPEWMEEGWGVGDNPRDRFCRWNSSKPLRRFKGYDEAVAFIFRLRQKRKRPHEVYTLVYVTLGALGRPISQPVSSLDEILAFEAKIAAEREEIEKHQAEQRALSEREFPARQQLREAYGYSRGASLSSFLGVVRTEGLAAAKTKYPTSSFYRNVRDLKSLGLLD